jgi:hypothetical protein
MDPRTHASGKGGNKIPSYPTRLLRYVLCQVIMETRGSGRTASQAPSCVPSPAPTLSPVTFYGPPLNRAMPMTRMNRFDLQVKAEGCGV